MLRHRCIKENIKMTRKGAEEVGDTFTSQGIPSIAKRQEKKKG